MKCQSCNVNGTNMKRCKACGKIYCISCALKGKGPYPKVSALNKCPYCLKLNMSEIAK